jgi:hypothetical protein
MVTHWCHCKNPSSADGKHETSRPEVHPCPNRSRSPREEVHPRPDLLPSLVSRPWCDSLVPLQNPSSADGKHKTPRPEVHPRPDRSRSPRGSASTPRPSAIPRVLPMVQLIGAAARTRHLPTANTRHRDRKCIHAQTAPDPRGEVRPRPDLLPSLVSCPWCNSLVPLQEPIIRRW